MAKAPSTLPRYKRIEKQIRDASNACRSAIELIDATVTKNDPDRQTLEVARTALAQARTMINQALGNLFDQIK